jgi:hypothetical protein
VGQTGHRTGIQREDRHAGVRPRLSGVCGMKLFLACAMALGMVGCHEVRSARKTVAHPTPDWSIDKCRITYKGRLVP